MFHNWKTDDLVSSKVSRIFILIASFFVANVVLAELLGIKIFSLEKSFGFSPLNLSFFGKNGLSMNLTVGVIIWPLSFLLTDMVNEYFGKRAVQFLSWLTLGVISYMFVMVVLCMQLAPADFWLGVNASKGITDTNAAYNAIFGQGAWIVVGSMVAFLIGQLVDVVVFHRLKRLTGERMIWVRSTGSTLVSQFIDSYVVLIIAFYFGANWDLAQVLAIGTMNYIYKSSMALLLTPVIYVFHHAIENYLGHELATELKQSASNEQ